MKKWMVRIYSDSQRTTLVDEAVETSPTFTSSKLQSHTHYYYSITSVSVEAEAESDTYGFITGCLPCEKIPFIEDFENW